MTDNYSSGFSDDDDLEPVGLIFTDDDLGRVDEPEAAQVEDAQDLPEDTYSVSYPPEADAANAEVAP